MTSRRLVLAALAVGAVLAVGGAASFFLRDGVEGNGDGPEAARTELTRTTETEQAGFLVVDQRKGAGAFFTEGAFPYVKVESEDGGVVAERLVRDSREVLPLLRTQLVPGTYRLVSHQRPCDGGCPVLGRRGLDPPTARCDTRFDIGAGQMLTAVILSRPGARCTILFGERVERDFAYRSGLEGCRRIASDRHHALRHWASNWGASSTQPEDLGAAYARMEFPGFEPLIRQAAAEGCVDGIRAVRHPIRFVLADTYRAGEEIDVAIENLGTRDYVFQPFYAACFLSYFDSSGRRFIVPPGTHCDLLGEETIRPGERKKLFTWNLDECVEDQWGCVRSRALPPGNYTIRGSFEPAGGGEPARARKTFRIVGA